MYRFSVSKALCISGRERNAFNLMANASALHALHFPPLLNILYVQYLLIYIKFMIYPSLTELGFYLKLDDRYPSAQFE